MKTLLASRRIRMYSSVATLLLCAEKLNAQIAYTDIEPDSTLDNMGETVYQSKFFDLNNDGIFDLKFISVYVTNYTDGNKVKAYGDHIQFANGPGPYGGHIEVVPDNYGDTISNNLAQDQAWRKEGYITSVVGTNYWDDGEEHYMPLRLHFDGSTYYGWIRMKLVDDGNPLRIRDYAYNLNPDQPIIAGQTLPCGDEFENNNMFQNAKRLKSGYIYHALIDTTTDRDFFKWSYSFDPAKPNVQISLYNLPGDYDLALFDSEKNLITKSINSGVDEERIFFNGTLASGDYFITVYPKVASSFDPVNCYSLQIETRHHPFFKSNDMGNDPLAISSVKVFPNPANNFINIMKTSGTMLELRMMDISGRELLHLKEAEETSSILADVSHLANGTYFVLVTSATDIAVTKFTIEK